MTSSPSSFCVCVLLSVVYKILLILSFTKKKNQFWKIFTCFLHYLLNPLNFLHSAALIFLLEFLSTSRKSLRYTLRCQNGCTNLFWWLLPMPPPPFNNQKYRGEKSDLHVLWRTEAHENVQTKAVKDPLDIFREYLNFFQKSLVRDYTIFSLTQ